MALIDEYKQAIRDVLDGRAKEAPRPSELPWTEDKAATMWAAAAAELIAEDSGGQKKFIVTLTPTALDYSGTMDKTVAEINAAYEAGQQIVFRVYSAAGTYNEVDCAIRYKNGDYTYPSFNAYIVYPTDNVFIFAYTKATDDGTKQTYSTAIFTLTPAS